MQMFYPYFGGTLASYVKLGTGVFSNGSYLRTLWSSAHACEICSQADIGSAPAMCSRYPHRPSLGSDLKNESRQRGQTGQSLEGRNEPLCSGSIYEKG